MMGLAALKMSSGSVYGLMQAAKGAALGTHALILANSTRDNREKFAKTPAEQVKPEDSEDRKIASEIDAAKRWEARVIQHERTHMQAGGEYAGAPSYVYGKGPDGKRYVVGGEVTMNVPAGGDLEKLKAALERVKRAAMAPADPSPQDQKSASMAAARQAAVNQEIQKKKASEAYEKRKEEKPEEHVLSVEPFRRFRFREVSSFEMGI